MSNTVRAAKRPPVPSGDMGIGLCLACLGEVMVNQREWPYFGVTLVPMPWPPGRADGVPVAVPACWQHVQQAAASTMRAPLPEAKGRIPKPRRRG